MKTPNGDEQGVHTWVAIDLQYDEETMFSEPEVLHDIAKEIAKGGLAVSRGVAEFIAHLLDDLEEMPANLKTITTARAMLQFLFIYSEEFQVAFRLFTLEHQGNLVAPMLETLKEAMPKDIAPEPAAKGVSNEV
jgi:hypothetical protein